MQVGSRVVRGPDWKWGNQDGGEGHVGTVVIVGRSGSTASPDKTVVVQWDGGTRTNYRCGYQSAYDICLLDNGPCGVRHVNITCNECRKKGIEGMRWQCTDCENYNLCSLCYMGNKHQLDHSFFRIEAPGNPSLFVGRREGKRRVQAKGIFPDARVIRGPDWDWDNQDGGPGCVGQVTDIRGWDMESFRSVANVVWQSAVTNVYRVGHKGKVDITTTKDGLGSLYYKDHLPKLGQSSESLVIPSGSGDHSVLPQFHVGDKVRVLFGVDVLNVMLEGHGGWNSKMEEVIGLEGTVHRITERGDVRVQYPGVANRWTFHPAALTKVVSFSVGDTVKVMNDWQMAKRLQVGHGEWADEMKSALGKTGKVSKIYSDGDLRIAVGGKTWTFNPAVVTIEQKAGTSTSAAGTSSPQSSDPDTVADSSLSSLISNLKRDGKTDIGAVIVNEAGQGHTETVKALLSIHPDKVNVRISGKTALQIASRQGHVETIKVLLNSGSNAQMKDSEGETALHYAAFGNRSEAARVLLESGADPNVINKNRCTPLHVAVSKGHVDVVRTLLKFKCNVNCQDTYGDTAMHDAITKEYEEIIVLLMNVHNADLTLCNKRGFNVLHHASLKGHSLSATRILLKCPQMVNVKKSDGFAALHLAAFNGHYDVCKVLLETDNCDVNVRNSRMETPLQLAVDKRYVAITELLLSHGAEVNAVDNSGDTALHVAVAYHSLRNAESPAESLEMSEGNGSFAVVKALMQHGADSKMKNGHHKTPLQICRDSRMRQLLQRTHSNTSNLSLQNEVLPSLSEDKAEPSIQSTAQQATCHLCDNPADARFEPCGHVASCSECAHLFKKCYQCKGSVELVVNVNEATETECIVCSDRAPEVTFEPCLHRIVCSDCAVRMKKCVKCQVKITRKLSTDGDLKSAQSSLNENDEKYLDTLQSLMSLKAKVREIEDETTCSICLENKRNIAFLCGHGTCADCAASLQICPMCRKPIERKIQLFS